jgi:hypothetical protein
MKKQRMRMNLNRKKRNALLKEWGYENYAAYLQSDLWFSIRAKVLKKDSCCCMCGSLANQVHHRTYTEANLSGITQKGLVPLCRECHFDIEFSGDKKCSLVQANSRLNQAQFEFAADLPSPTKEEINMFLTGKKIELIRKIAVKRHLKLSMVRS